MEEEMKLKSGKVADLLNRRHKERQVTLDTAQELKQRNASEAERVDYFTEIFAERARAIEKNISNLENVANDKALLTGLFSKITYSIQELQQYLSASTLFLPDRRINSSQTTINELTSHADELRLKLLPKKRFGFKAKQTAVKPPLQNGNDQLDNKLKTQGEEHRKQLVEWTAADQSNQSLRLSGAAVDNKDLTFSTLTNCYLEIHGHPGSLQLSNLRNCVVVCGPVARSVFAENCHNCKFAFACQQLRLHSSNTCDIYLHVTCRAIIEDCTKIQMAPFSYLYAKIDEDFADAGIDAAVNNWLDVADFNWLSPDKPSPNWRVLVDEDRIEDWRKFTGMFCNEYCCI